MKYFTSILLSLSLSFVAFAQFPTDQAYQTFNSVTPALPSFNMTVDDTSVPETMTIKQITEFVPAWNWYPTHEYSKIQPWNADASVYKFYSVAIYNANTHQKIRDLPGGAIYPSYWSNTNADILYGFKENGTIKTYNINTEVISTVGHIYFDDANQIAYDVVKLGPGEGNIDKNDHYVAFVAKKNTDMYVITYNLQTNQVIHTELFAGAWGNSNDAPAYVDWVSVSQSGNYIGIMWNHNTTSQANPYNTHYGVEIYNTTDMQYLRRIASYGNHGDFGYAINGDEVFVQFWGETGTLNMYYLNGNGRVVLSTNADFNSEGHVSCRNLNRPGYAYVSQDYADHSGQIVAFKLDNSGLVEHFGHHYSTSSSYLKSPMPCPNPNGDKVMFKSDFGDATAAVIYVFETELSNTASVNDSSLAKFEIYPNPVKDILTVKTDDIIHNIHIYNTLGQKVKSIPFINDTSLALDVSNLKIGFYTLEVHLANSTINRKIIIQK